MDTNVFKHLNYRQFLREIIQEKKKTAKHFSHRYVHQKLGIAPSSGFLANVLSGKKNLTFSQTLKLAKLLDLKSSEITYFENLVLYNHSTSIEEKTNYLKRLTTQQSLQLKKLNKNQYNIFAKWHYVFIHELISFYPINNNYKEVGSLLNPSINDKEVKDAIEVLAKLKMIEKNGKGYFQQTGKIFTTGDEVHSLQLANFQMKTMDLGKRALEKIAQNERDISFVAISLGDNGIKKVKAEVAKFRKRLLRISQEEEDPNSVYQCNFQIFPVVAKKKGEA